jgi:hypothetical protein
MTVYSKSPANLQQIRCVSSKSTASLKHFSTNGFVCSILTCRDAVDKCLVSPTSCQQMRSMWFRIDKSTASLQHFHKYRPIQTWTWIRFTHGLGWVQNFSKVIGWVWYRDRPNLRYGYGTETGVTMRFWL